MLFKVVKNSHFEWCDQHLLRLTFCDFHIILPNATKYTSDPLITVLYSTNGLILYKDLYIIIIVVVVVVVIIIIIIIIINNKKIP